MRPAIIAIGLILTLGACSSEGLNPVISTAIDAVRGGVSGGAAPSGATPGAGQPITREAIDARGVATIRARLESDARPSFLQAASANGGHVTYINNFRQQITLRGTAITATRGLGTDLLSRTSRGPDPLVTPIPPEAWPAEVIRLYEFPAEGARGDWVEVRCTPVADGATSITILGKTYQGVQFTETCRNDTLEFQNLYFAEAETGFVWRSLQWTGPRQGLIDLENVLPYSGD